MHRLSWRFLLALGTVLVLLTGLTFTVSSSANTLIATSTRWPTVTRRSTDTRWPTVTLRATSTRWPTSTLRSTATRWPTIAKRPTDTRWPTITKSPTRTPIATRTPSPSPTPETIGPLVQSPYIRQLFMLDVSNGWAVGDFYLLRTLDGGVNWYDVTPPGVTSLGYSASAFFLDTRVGWLLTDQANLSSGTLYRTRDGGTTWISFDVPFGNGHIQFLDNSNGFVMAGVGASMNRQSIAIYQTVDGGETWTRNFLTEPDSGQGLPLSGQKTGMVFRDQLHGWIGGSTSQEGFLYLYATADSGSTWSHVDLPLAPDYEYALTAMDAPILFGANEIVLPVSQLKGSNHDLFIYASHDGGVTWSVSTGFARQGEIAYTDFFSPTEGITWDWAGIFRVTNDGGATWTDVTPDTDFTSDLRNIDFVSRLVGWAVEAHAYGYTSLYKTMDGGATWTLLSTNKPVTP